MSRASTRGGNGGGAGGILMWTLVAVVVGAVVIGAAFVLNNMGSGYSATPVPPGVLTPADITSNGLTLGNADAKVTIDVWGDFRCSQCFLFTVESGTETKMVANFVKTGQAKLVWHDYNVIDQLAANAGQTASIDAANAGRCAADQGKFWLMHDWLYANQATDETPGAFTKDRLKAIGKAAGIPDLGKFNSCVDNGQHLDDIRTEIAAKPADVNGTPTLFVNGKPLGTVDASTGARNVPTYDEIAAAVNTALGLPTPSASPSTSVAPSPTATPTPTPTATTTATASVAPSASASTKP